MRPTAVHDLADKPDFLCLSGTKVPSGERELPDFTVIAGDLGQALQGADIRCEADVDLGDGKLGVGRAQTDITCGCNVYSEAEGEAVECADDGLAAGGEGGDGRLEGEEVAVERECFACRVGSGSEDRLRLDCGALAEVRESGAAAHGPSLR